MDEGQSCPVAAVSEGAKEPWQTRSYYACGIIGYAFYLAWLVVLILNAGFSPEEAIGADLAVLATGALLLGIVVVLGISLAIPSALSTKAGSLALAALSLLCVLPFVVPALDVSLAARCAVALASGAGGGAMLLLAAPFMCSLARRSLIVSLSIGCACAAMLAAGLLSCPDAVARGAMPVLVIVSIAACLRSRSLALRHRAAVSADGSEKRNRNLVRSGAAVAGSSLCLGFVLYCLSGALSLDWRFGFMGLVAAAAAGAAGFAAFRRRPIGGAIQIKLFLPCAMIGFLPIPFFGEAGCLIGCAILLFVFTVQFIVGMGSIAQATRSSGPSMLRAFTVSRAGSAAGAFLGYAFGFAAFELSEPLGSMGSIGTPFVFVALLIVVGTFFMQYRVLGE